MQRKLVTGTYIFCTNSHYYEALVQYVKGKDTEVKKEKNCDNIIFDTNLYKDMPIEDICQKFKFLYKSFGEYHGKKISDDNTLTDYDCNFLNYWLNDKIKKTVNDDTNYVKVFYQKIKEKDNTFFSNPKDLEEHLHVIDPDVLENMKLLYELYDTKQKIVDIMHDSNSTEDKKELCKKYTKKCYDNYMEGINNCLNGYDDFDKALKVFQRGYKYLTDEVPDKSGYCKISEHFRLPEYDFVLNAKQRRIMTTKILSASLILPFVIPLLYKYTPFGPFLRTKINLVKRRWLNSDENGSELLSKSTDTEDNISENGEYNIGYYSGINF
ncbi:PIR Superfamily Protein [Plasmodium ovale wallikeri]|uniref:PIR Superfamily Protein n=1 Tax=Plasmodium ovale wallikeri TaxID=864142 RepID=A0A1A9AFR8_PLAOA|nr:PIR Superfamily Protein [Plasmodium ovale wallikeri]SBT58214.1 PIR Superfamily Protein [Plasmodium ovale wallikeri]